MDTYDIRLSCAATFTLGLVYFLSVLAAMGSLALLGSGAHEIESARDSYMLSVFMCTNEYESKIHYFLAVNIACLLIDRRAQLVMLPEMGECASAQNGSSNGAHLSAVNRQMSEQ